MGVDLIHSPAVADTRPQKNPPPPPPPLRE